MVWYSNPICGAYTGHMSVKNTLTVDVTPTKARSAPGTHRSGSSPTEDLRSSTSSPGPIALSRVTKSRTGTTPTPTDAGPSDRKKALRISVTKESANSTPPTLASFVSVVPQGFVDRSYVFEGSIGGGACAKIKKAHSVKLNKKVAIKIADLKKTGKDVVDKFLPRELITLKALSGNDRIVQLHEYFMESNKLYIVLEYAENGDLLDYICSKKKLSERTSRMFYMDILSGLSACHKRGIIHRDIKCENLLLDGNYRIKLADFGFARSQRFSELLRTFCGSLAYTAPEIILEKPYNGKASDIWSSGVVLYAMLSGRLPFNDSSTKAIIGYINDGVLLPSFFTMTCRDLIVKVLTPDPKKRASIEQILRHPFMRIDLENYANKDTDPAKLTRAKF